MQEQDIITFLSLVGDELEYLGVFSSPVRLLLIGGAYMLTQIHNRTVTRDVDVVVLDLDPLSEEYRLFRQAVSFVAHDMKVSPAWLSDNISQFLQSLGTVPAGTLWLAKGKLEVYIPDACYILALKLFSGREKDEEDIRALLPVLEITTRKQAEALLKQYIETSVRKEYAQEIEDTLAYFFKKP